MNGINYNTLFGNTGLFTNQENTVKENTKFKGTLTGAKEKESTKRDSAKDSVEINGQSREIPKAGYDRPKRVTGKTEEGKNYQKIDENGIQEGVELSDAAKKLLEELREKYTNMDIKVVNWSTDEEQEYYASTTSKEYSVLIAPEALEAMAADESVRAQYESVLDSAGEKYDTLKEELGDDFEQVRNFSITIDRDGKVSYALQLIKDFEERNSQRAKETAERSKETDLEEKITEKQEKKKKEQLEKIEAESLEELIAAVREKLHPEEAVTEDEKAE